MAKAGKPQQQATAAEIGLGDHHGKWPSALPGGQCQRSYRQRRRHPLRRRRPPGSGTGLRPAPCGTAPSPSRRTSVTAASAGNSPLLHRATPPPPTNWSWTPHAPRALVVIYLPSTGSCSEARSSSDHKLLGDGIGRHCLPLPPEGGGTTTLHRPLPWRGHGLHGSLRHRMGFGMKAVTLSPRLPYPTPSAQWGKGSPAVACCCGFPACAMGEGGASKIR